MGQIAYEENRLKDFFKYNKNMQYYAKAVLNNLYVDDNAQEDVKQAIEKTFERFDENCKWDVIAYYTTTSKPKPFARCANEFANDLLEFLKLKKN